MGIRIDGLDKLRKRLDPADAVQQLGRGLFVEAHKIMTTSKRDFVPVDTGVLRASGHVNEPVVSKTKASVVLGYGGAASAYALIQHERLDYAHTVGGAKYLETPVKQAAKGIGPRIAKNLDLF